MRERLNVANTKKNPNGIVETNLAFASVAKSNIEFLMAKNKELAKKLHASM